jgi:hypothetical protein
LIDDRGHMVVVRDEHAMDQKANPLTGFVNSISCTPTDVASTRLRRAVRRQLPRIYAA